MWRRVGRWEDRQDRQEDRQDERNFFTYFFPYTSCQRQLQLLRYFMGPFSVFRWVKDLCSYQTIGSTRPRYTPLDYPFTLVWFANNTALILPPETDQRRSEISPLATPEAFTQKRRWRIGAGSLHVNGSMVSSGRRRLCRSATES